jgi:hypothetical protein
VRQLPLQLRFCGGGSATELSIRSGPKVLSLLSIAMDHDKSCEADMISVPQGHHRVHGYLSSPRAVRPLPALAQLCLDLPFFQPLTAYLDLVICAAHKP